MRKTQNRAGGRQRRAAVGEFGSGAGVETTTPHPQAATCPSPIGTVNQPHDGLQQDAVLQAGRHLRTGGRFRPRIGRAAEGASRKCSTHHSWDLSCDFELPALLGYWLHGAVGQWQQWSSSIVGGPCVTCSVGTYAASDDVVLVCSALCLGPLPQEPRGSEGPITLSGAVNAILNS